MEPGRKEPKWEPVRLPRVDLVSRSKDAPTPRTPSAKRRLLHCLLEVKCRGGEVSGTATGNGSGARSSCQTLQLAAFS